MRKRATLPAPAMTAASRTTPKLILDVSLVSVSKFELQHTSQMRERQPSHDSAMECGMCRSVTGCLCETWSGFTKKLR